MIKSGEPMVIKIASLFSGIGGFELGVERASTNTGIDTKIVFASEIDKFARQTYVKNFGVEPHGDITKINAADIPDHDILCGGFPCQSFSIAGKRRGFEDTRGTLFFEIARVLERKQPRMFLLENVKGLLNHDRGETFAKILQTMDELGYDAEWQVFNSKNHGVPQNRERVFIIGHLRGAGGRQIFPITENGRPTDDIQGQYTNCLTARYEGAQATGSYIIEPTVNALTTGSTHTVASYIVENQLNAQGIRRLTPIECERLQGFKDNWTECVSNTQRYKQIGNAVTVNVVDMIMQKILKSLKEE